MPTNAASSTWLMASLPVVLAAAAIAASQSILLLPLLRRVAMAQPNSRSSHSTPTPQGGGIAVVVSTIVTVVAAGFAVELPTDGATRICVALAAAALLALVGAVDDMRGLRTLPRLLLQTMAMAVVIAILPDDWRLSAQLPWWLDRILLLIAGVWFINAVNFMDGLDWMTVAEIVPVTAALAILGMLGALPEEGLVMALALCGAVIGFAPFNRPVARLFLGDAGSLPIGLLVGSLLMMLATRGHLIAALLLPLYYLADATLTLLRRMLKGERFWQAHRTHFYQRAHDSGWKTWEIIAHVVAVNLCLASLATLAVLWPGGWTEILCFVVGAAIVGLLLHAFSTRRPEFTRSAEP